MDFLSDAIWWGTFIGASVVFAIMLHSRARKSYGLVYSLPVVVAFLYTGWQSGLVVCIGGALAGVLLYKGVIRVLVPPLPEMTKVAGGQSRQPLVPQFSEIIRNGKKVWRLVDRGKLFAYEDPRDHLISVVRPEDLDAVRGHQSEDEKGDSK